MRLHYLDAVLPGQPAQTAQIADAQLGIAAEGALGDHQFVAGRVVVAEYRLQQQLPVLADVVAVHRQRVGCAVAAGGHVDAAGVVQCRQPACGIGPDTAPGDRHDAAVIDGEGTGCGCTVTEKKVPGQSKVRVVVQRDVLPAKVARGPRRGGVVEGQAVIAHPAIQ
ncbi:hypothetical protein D3C84_620030 [compost metagenome]